MGVGRHYLGYAWLIKKVISHEQNELSRWKLSDMVDSLDNKLEKLSETMVSKLFEPT